MKAVVLAVATILVASQCHGSEYEFYPLELRSDGLTVHYPPEVWCPSWRLAAEAHNYINWKTVPQKCAEYVESYIQGDQYDSDSKYVNQQAYFFAKSIKRNENDVFIFSVDGTVLSNVPYYSKHGYGVNPYNATVYDAWVLKGEAPALAQTLKNYNNLLSLGFKIVFLTGRTVDKKAVTEANLKEAGFHTWEKLILKDPIAYNGQNAASYKAAERKKLTKEGWRIVGNIGDQWSDITGRNVGLRTFKLPNPMYFIA
nr:Stem 28 kDa glycoprotein [Cajanus cajan]